jgi:hypothetical protein
LPQALLQQLQHALTSEQRPANRQERRQRRAHGAQRLGDDTGAAHDDLSHELVAAARYGADPWLCVVEARQHLPGNQHSPPHRALADHLLWPQIAEQLVGPDHPVAALYEVQEKAQHLRLHICTSAAMSQLEAGYVEFEGAEAVNHVKRTLITSQRP